MAERALPDLRSRIRIDDTDLNRAERSAKSFGASVETSAAVATSRLGGLGSAFSRVGSSAAAIAPMGLALGVGLAGAAVGMGALGLKALQASSQMEQSKVAFTTMLGSAQAADAFLKQLFQFASTTPFTFVGLQASAKQLLAFGFNAKQIIPMMTAIGDSVSALGGGEETLNRVTTALGQMQAKGKVSAEEMMQLAESGIPAWQFLATAIGKDIPTAMKLAEQGGISASVGINAILTGMESKFGGLMAKQSQTLAGMWSNVQDVAGQTLVVLGDKIVAAFDLKTKLAGALSFLQQLSGLVQGKLTMAQVFGPEVAASLARVGVLFHQLSDAAASVGRAIAPVVTQLAKLALPHLDVIIVFGLAAAFSLLAIAAGAAAVSVIAATWPILLIIVAVAALAAGVYLLINNWSTVSAFFVGLWETVKAAFIGAWNGILAFLGGVWSAITGAIGGFFSSIGMMAMNAWQAFAAHPLYWIAYIAVFVPVTLAKLAIQLAEWFSQVLLAAGAWALGMIGYAIQAAVGFLTSFGLWLNQLPGRVAGWLGSVISAAVRFASEFPGHAWTAAVNFGVMLVRGLQSLPGQMVTIGVQIVEGLMQGIRNAAGRLWEAARDVVMGALAGARDALGIHSPSRAFALQVGLPSVQGIIAGLEQGLPALRVAVDELHPAHLGSAASATGSAAAGTTYQQPITVNVSQPSSSAWEIARELAWQMKTATA